MKAIYNHLLYTVRDDDGEGVFLADGLHVPYNSERLIVNPTDTQIEELPTPYPVYGEHDSSTHLLRRGLYLALFHGSYGQDRLSRDKRFQDWGFNGPVIGPLRWVHTTYKYHVKFQFESEADAERYRPWLDDGVRWVGVDQELFVATEPSKADIAKGINCEDCIIFAGDAFGDWTVFNHPKLK